MRKSLVLSFIILGGLIAIFSLIADYLGIGEGGLQAAQLLTLAIGLALIFLGVLILIGSRDQEITFPWLASQVSDRLNKSPALVWVASAYLLSICVFLFSYMFFNPRHHTRYIDDYLPGGVQVGADLRIYVDAARDWMQKSPSYGFEFDPLTVWLFAPLILLGYPNYYYLVTGLTLFSYLLLLLLALAISGENKHAPVAFLAAVSLVSFGAFFELERGQLYSIIFMLGLFAIYLFHYFPKLRLLSYALFCIAVQIKFTPALLIFLFVDNWRDHLGNLKRFLFLGLVNLSLLFIFGFAYSISFFNHRLFKLQSDIEYSIRNHSILSSTAVFSQSGFGLVEGAGLAWIRDHSGLIAMLLVAFYIACFLLILRKAYKTNKPGVNPDLLLVSVIGGLVLPTISHDYTLPVLTIPFALMVSHLYARDYPWPKMVTILITALVAFAYSVTLFPFQIKPEPLQNNLPMIYLILTASTLCYVIGKLPSTTVEQIAGKASLPANKGDVLNS